MANSKEPAKDPNISQAPAADLESENTSQDPGEWLYKSDRTELTELTPVEAFKWNVEGDQSPCRSTVRHISQEETLILLSSGSCGLCVQQR
jgi:hypothetical protein